jgi:hypothetical protein
VTVIVSTIWGGRISILVDRRISRRSTGHVNVLDDDSNKIVVVQCRGALFAIAYTGIAVVHESWTDSLIANLLAHRKLVSALAQPGSRLLARPAFALIDELKVNLNGALNSESRSRLEKLELLIQGWEYGKGRLIPFSCKLKRGAKRLNGNRYFYLEHHPVAKFFRENPTGLWGETLGDDGGAIDTALENIASSVGFTHDKVEQLIAQAICVRSLETQTVSPSSYALQLDPRISDSQVTFTFYPHKASTDGYPFFSPWVMTPRMFCSPTKVTSAFAPRSECGDYLLGGFSDGHTLLNVVIRLPINFGMPQGKGALSYGYQRRPTPP